mgnify:CR=1 FL=1
MQEITIENIEARLGELTILELRQTARAIGVERPAACKKAEVVKKIIAIAEGKAEPVFIGNTKFGELAGKGLVQDIQTYRDSIIGKK